MLRIHFECGGVVELVESRSPSDLAGIIRATLFQGGRIDRDAYDRQKGTLEVGGAVVDEVEGVPKRVVTTDGGSPALGRLSSILAVLEAVKMDQGKRFARRLVEIRDNTGSWGDPVLWEAVAERLGPTYDVGSVAKAIGAR